MRNSEHSAVAFLYGLEGRAIGQVIIDEWFGVDLGEEVTDGPRPVGLFGQGQPEVVQFDKLTVANSAVAPRIRSARPWLRAKKGRSTR